MASLCSRWQRAKNLFYYPTSDQCFVQPSNQTKLRKSYSYLWHQTIFEHHFLGHPIRSFSVRVSHNKLHIEVFFTGIILFLSSYVLQKYLVSILIGFIVDAGRNWIVPFSVWLVVGHLLSGEYVCWGSLRSDLRVALKWKELMQNPIKILNFKIIVVI